MSAKCECCGVDAEEPMRLNPVEYLAKVSTVTRFLCKKCYAFLANNVEDIDREVLAMVNTYLKKRVSGGK